MQCMIIALPYIPIKEYAFSLPRSTASILGKTINLLSKVKFNSQGEVCRLDHIIEFIHKSLSCGIVTDNELGRLFTLTFKGRIRSWYEALLAKSIHIWEEFMEMFLVAHHKYNYNELHNKFESIRKGKDESM